MKIAVLGGYGPTQSVGAVFRAFQRAGHEVVHVPTLPQFSWTTSMEHAGIDLLFTFKIALEKVPTGFIRALPVKAKVFWSFDDPHWVDKGRDLHWAREHDIILTSCRESVTTYQQTGHTAYFLPPAMDLEYYQDWKEVGREDHLASFICTTLYPPKDFPDNLISREVMCRRLTAEFGSDFALYGYGRDVVRMPEYRTSLNWEDTLPLAIRRTRMNINNHLTAKKHLYFNERFFQIVATRRAMFVDRVAGFEALFGPDALVYYSSVDELTEKLLHYKDRPYDLAVIGDRGFKAVSGWTYDAFATEVLRAAEGHHADPNFIPF